MKKLTTVALLLLIATACKTKKEIKVPAVFWDSSKVANTVNIYMKEHEPNYKDVSGLYISIDTLTERAISKDQVTYFKGIADFAKYATKEEMQLYQYNPKDAPLDKVYFQHYADSIKASLSSFDDSKPLGIRAVANYRTIKSDMTYSNDKSICFYIDSSYHIINKLQYLSTVTIPLYPNELNEFFYP